MLSIAGDFTMIDDTKLFRKLRLRVMPILVICFIVAYVDRANLGFAAIAMNAKYGFTATVYGWAAGIFFFGYTLAEIPSNLILSKVGARRWIARIMITWGLISSLTAFVWNAESLYVARFLEWRRRDLFREYWSIFPDGSQIANELARLAGFSLVGRSRRSSLPRFPASSWRVTVRLVWKTGNFYSSLKGFLLS